MESAFLDREVHTEDHRLREVRMERGFGSAEFVISQEGPLDMFPRRQASRGSVAVWHDWFQRIGAPGVER